MTGTTLFTVSRLLSDWKERGLLTPGRECVCVHNIKALREFAENSIRATASGPRPNAFLRFLCDQFVAPTCVVPILQISERHRWGNETAGMPGQSRSVSEQRTSNLSRDSSRR